MEGQLRSATDVKDTATGDEKVQLLRDAVKKHQQLAAAAARGEGVDRVIMGTLLTRFPLGMSTHLWNLH